MSAPARRRYARRLLAEPPRTTAVRLEALNILRQLDHRHAD
jgi:hypothetical protein